ncbi:MAG: hypothetical protein ACI977_000673 [Candidatus Nanohaloarchaea archaeon]|jgi:hypothetical protein
MARYKAGILLTSLLFISVIPASAFTVQVSIADMTSASVKDVQYQENVSTVQNMNASIENTGSIGCGYRLKADYSYGNQSFERYSGEHQLWQGDSDRATLHLLATNYTGTVRGNLSVQYCGQEKQVERFNFTTENVTLPNATEVRTLKADEKSAEIRSSQYKSGRLVPIEAPSYWKASAAELEEGKATLEYEAPIFDPRETITYALVQNQSVEATVETSLEENPTLLNQIMNANPALLYMVILLLAALNVAQILRTRRNKD